MAKERIELELFPLQLRNNKVVVAKVIDLADHFRGIKVLEKTVQDKMAEINAIEAQLTTKRAEQSQSVVSLAILMRQLQQVEPEDGMDELFFEGNEDIGAHRARRDLGELTQLLRLLYVTDCLDQLPGDLIGIVRRHTPDINA